MYSQLARAVLQVLYGLILLAVERGDTAVGSNYPILNRAYNIKKTYRKWQEYGGWCGSSVKRMLSCRKRI